MTTLPSPYFRHFLCHAVRSQRKRAPATSISTAAATARPPRHCNGQASMHTGVNTQDAVALPQQPRTPDTLNTVTATTLQCGTAAAEVRPLNSTSQPLALGLGYLPGGSRHCPRTRARTQRSSWSGTAQRLPAGPAPTTCWSLARGIRRSAVHPCYTRCHPAAFR